MKFLHTADWQIGMKADSVGPAAQRVREERLAAGQRVVEAANSEGAEFMLVAGDLFEDNAVDRMLVQRTADLLSRFHGQVFIIPGNHDPLVPGSVWDHPAWNSARNLVVIKEQRAVEVPGGFLFPCPIHDKYSRKDPTAWIQGQTGAGIRIGMAHGNVEGLPVDHPDHPIPRDAVARCNLDYLALGHWHSTAIYKDANGDIRMAYSGTHETTSFGERDSGNAIWLEIEKPGIVPQVRIVPIGRLKWLIYERDIQLSGQLTQLRQELERMSDPEAVLLDLRLKGLLDLDEQGELSHIEDVVRSRFLYAHTDVSALVPAPGDNLWIESLPAGIIREAATRLRQTAASGGQMAETVQRALMMLYTVAREVRR
jgi:DNA repair exonuclease SbcCD nuclease subunit